MHGVDEVHEVEVAVVLGQCRASGGLLLRGPRAAGGRDPRVQVAKYNRTAERVQMSVRLWLRGLGMNGHEVNASSRRRRSRWGAQTGRNRSGMETPSSPKVPHPRAKRSWIDRLTLLPSMRWDSFLPRCFLSTPYRRWMHPDAYDAPEIGFSDVTPITSPPLPTYRAISDYESRSRSSRDCVSWT
ncbi:hypothetical protein PENSPDRAFT_150997 [Peniophora sp. CONT]|nr:hypothetical protein PENSPDRAFT_150997 [Peniophora sp. CONT]